MPELKMDAEGFLLNDEGERFEIEGEPMRVTNAQPKEETERIIKDRLARQADKIKALEQQANKGPELEKMLEGLRNEKKALEDQLDSAKKQAEEEVSSQLSAAEKRAKAAETELESERTGRIRDQVTNSILTRAGDRFINPADDVVPKLLGVHKREAAKDKQGNTIDGQFLDTFKLAWRDEKGEEVEEHLPLEKALEVLASKPEYQHYVRASGRSGSGGGNYANISNMKRSEMSAAQKAEFVGQHGVEAFQGLPE